jgi:2-polyprenyl-3-methyl-5-hydroxy-6-metoxy-1,4-benzoquinol methylase
VQCPVAEFSHYAKGQKMDQWTQTSKQAQDYLFRRMDKNGYYLPHQAIYGFATYRILQFCEIQTFLSSLDDLSFDSFLDVGCAEGFYPRLVQVRYGAEVFGMDLSVPAVRRMWEYNRIEGVCGDAHNIPVKDKAFDVVLCNDMVEHVTEPQKVISELMRVAKKHLFIGVPLAFSKSEIKEFKPDLNAERDQHVHIFTPESFRQILPKDAKITMRYSRSLPILLMNAAYKRSLGKIGNFLPLVELMMKIDRILSKNGTQRPTHAFAHLDLTDAVTPNKRTEISGESRKSQISRLLLKDIYRINREELNAEPIRWETEGSINWRGYLIKPVESPPTRMEVNERIISLLACPKCKSGVIKGNNTILLCSVCGSSYPSWDGIPIMYIK